MSAEVSREGDSRWKLSAASFERLLAVLDGDRERAALAYEQLRGRLIGLLRWWGAPQAEDLADETFDRVARKLEEGAVVSQGSFGAYVRGVARMIFYEASRRPAAAVPERLPEVVAVAAGAEDAGRAEAGLACLDRCLEALAGHERTLVLRYYDAQGKHADVRRNLAQQLGISPTALRIRTHRLRERLEQCVGVCLSV